MKTLADEFEQRRRFAGNIRYDDTTRLTGLFEWMLGQPRIADIIRTVEEQAPFQEILSRSSSREPPRASTPEEVASVGFHFIRQARGGASMVDQMFGLGIVPPFFNNRAEEVLEEGMERYVIPALDYVASAIERPARGAEADAIIESRLRSVLSPGFRRTCPETADLLRHAGGMFALTDSDNNWSGVTNSCRQALIVVIRELTNANRLPATAKKAGNVKGAISEIVGLSGKPGRLDNAYSRLVSAVWDYVQPLTHRPSTSRAEAERAYIWTVLSIGELWDLSE